MKGRCNLITDPAACNSELSVEIGVPERVEEEVEDLLLLVGEIDPVLHMNWSGGHGHGHGHGSCAAEKP